MAWMVVRGLLANQYVQHYCSSPNPPTFSHILHQTVSSLLYVYTKYHLLSFALDTIHHKFLPNWATALPPGRPPAKTVFCRPAPGLNQLNKGRGGGWLTGKSRLTTQFDYQLWWKCRSYGDHWIILNTFFQVCILYRISCIYICIWTHFYHVCRWQDCFS